LVLHHRAFIFSYLYIMQLINQYFIKRHITSFSILVFLAAFAVIQTFKPRVMYDNDGSLRQFGIGFKRKTVIPAWLVAIIVAILSYLLVLYASTPRLYM
jgi:hypothetical protein